MCAQRRDKQQEESASPTSEQLASVDLEKTEGTETQDATSQPEFALVLNDELKTEQSGDQIAQEEVQTKPDDALDVVQTQAVDAQETVQSLGDEISTLEPPHADIVEVLAVTSKSEAGFYRGGIKFERLNATPVEVLADGSGLVGDYPLTISQVQAIRNEPHLKCELVHHKVTM